MSQALGHPLLGLRRYTAARIALGRAGISLTTAAQLQFRLDHARARDAVQLALDTAALCRDIEALGLPAVALHSAAADRRVYLQRPDLGRRLDEASRARLQAGRGDHNGNGDGRPYELALVVADGLSALAAQRHAVPLLRALRSRLGGWRLAPVAVVEQGRVAIGDEIGAALGAACVVVLIGERPGLSAPDSLGLYLSWAPRVGLVDAQRNCISNVRPEGLAIEAAAARLQHLLEQARQLDGSGLALKDDSDAALPAAAGAGNFLLPDAAPREGRR